MRKHTGKYEALAVMKTHGNCLLEKKIRANANEILRADVGGLTAILARVDRRAEPAGWKRRVAAKRVLDGLVHRQKQLEDLMCAGDVLAIRPGTPLSHQSAAAMLVANMPEISSAFEDISGLVQFQIMISAPSGGRTTKIKKITETNDEWRSSLSSRIRSMRNDWDSRLAEVSSSVHELPAGEPEMLMNRALLVDRDAERALDRALREIDHGSSGKLHIRCIGPMPPVSFAMLAVEEIAPPTIRAAARRLGLPDETGDPDAAFRHALGLRAGTASATSRDLDALKGDRDLLRRYAAARARILEWGGGAEGSIPLTSVVTDGTPMGMAPSSPGVAAA